MTECSLLMFWLVSRFDFGVYAYVSGNGTGDKWRGIWVSYSIVKLVVCFSVCDLSVVVRIEYK